MKKICFIPLLFVTISAYAQSVSFDSLNIYYVSLKTHIDYLKNHNMVRRDKIIYIQADEHVVEKIPLEIYGCKIVFLDIQQIKEKAKKDFLPLVEIRPLELWSNRLIVTLIDFTVVYKRRNLNYSNSGGSQFEFQYDCYKDKFTLKNSQHNGI